MAAPENTARNIEGLKPFQFRPGVSGNPAGKPKGARDRLGQTVIRDLLADFEEHGKTVIEEVRKKRPEAYLACVVSLLPKQKQELQSPFGDLSDEELVELEKFLKASRAKNITPNETTDSINRRVNVQHEIDGNNT